MKEFEELIDEINGQGFYQKRLLYFVLSPLFFFLPLSWLNELFLLHVPSHWCYHPSQDNLNSTQIEGAVSIDQNTIDQNTIDKNTIDQNMIDQNTIDWNTIDQNTLDWNTIDQNISDQNTMDQNTLD